MECRNIQTAELFRSMDRVRKAWHSVSPCDSLSKSQFGTLMAIHHFEITETDSEKSSHVKLSALANSMGQSLPALSQRVKLLEDNGYICRVPDPRDRRAMGIELTDEGSKVLELARQRFDGILSYAADYLGAETSDKLISLLNQLAEALEIAVSHMVQTEEQIKYDEIKEIH